MASIVAVGASLPFVAGSARADDPPALGKSVAINDTLARNVVAGVTQADASTLPGATASRIGFFTATPTAGTLDFSIFSQSTAVPADGYTSSVALYLLTTAGGTYRAATAADGSFEVTQSVDGVWTHVGAATFTVNGQLTELDVDNGAWTAPGTNIVIVRRDLDASMNGWESATPPVLLDAVDGIGLGGSIPLLDHGSALAADGLSNKPCVIANMPTVSIDPASSAITFTFASPPPADLRGTIGGVSLSDLVNPPYVSGLFGSSTWAGMRAGTSTGDYAVTVAGNAVTVATANATDSVFASNHQALTIGISDPAGCYSLSPAVPFATLIAPVGTPADAVQPVAAAATTIAGADPSATSVVDASVTTLVDAAATTPVDAAATSTSIAAALDGSASTTIATVADSGAVEQFDNSDPATPWGKIIGIGLVAIALGCLGGIALTRWDRKRTAARERAPIAQKSSRSAVSVPASSPDSRPKTAPSAKRAELYDADAETDDDASTDADASTDDEPPTDDERGPAAAGAPSAGARDRPR